ncbi:ImmA/IrrE family metallo-endopeptidase, partial [Staphylococcus aureus]|nr:ImmA/IrrE family metallo-endopeptidase [Staphylococcus aureus]
MKKAELNHFIEETSEQALKKLEEFFYSPDSVEEYISFLSQFYNYSPRNQLLIANQYKGAKAIAPYKKWQSLGAQVQKGEKAIKILVPSERKTFVRDIDNKKSVLPIKEATKEEKALMKKGEIKINKQLVFVKGSVFDIRQTDMPEDKYPQMIQQLRGEVTDYAKKIQCLNAIAEAYNIDVKESEDSIQGARGYYTETSTGDKKIILNKDNEQAENTRTMIHELSHALLHGKDKIIETPTTLGMKEEEFQAEMTALIVGSYMGLDNNDDSIQYI